MVECEKGEKGWPYPIIVESEKLRREMVECEKWEKGTQAFGSLRSLGAFLWFPGFFRLFGLFGLSGFFRTESEKC
jgi:hypothetical protein